MFEEYADASFEASDRAIWIAMKRGYKMYEISLKLNRAKWYVYNINNRTCGMSIKSLVDCSNFLKVNLDYLLTGKNKDAPYEKVEYDLKAIVRAGQKLKEPLSKRLKVLKTNVANQVYEDMPVRKFLCYMDKYKMSGTELLKC